MWICFLRDNYGLKRGFFKENFLGTLKVLSVDFFKRIFLGTINVLSEIFHRNFPKDY